MYLRSKNYLQKKLTMPVNRNALIRYRILDECLRNPYKRYDLEELIEACSDGLYEYAGIRGGVSRRTVQLDLQMMRSDQLGYNAPIEVYEKKFYRYSDRDYSIRSIPLKDADLDKLHEVVDILRQFVGFNHFNDMSSMVQRLEDRIVTQKNKTVPIINLEKNLRLKGLEHLDVLYHAIQNKRQLEIEYQSFKARQASNFILHAFVLKEFRNRWFVLGRLDDARENNILLALDRINQIRVSSERRVEFPDLDAAGYFDDVVGVTVNQLPVEDVQFSVNRKDANYVITKPIHHSQTEIARDSDSITFQIRVKWNFELESVLFSHSASLRVLSPPARVRRMKSILNKALKLYTK